MSLLFNELPNFGQLQLRPLQRQQSAAFLAHIEANRQRYLDVIPFVASIHNVTDMQQFIEGNLQRQQAQLGYYFTLWQAQQMAGYLLVRELEPAANWAEIGYMLGHQWQGQGVISAACRWLINTLFAQGVDKIVINCNDDNRASIAIANKLGFTLEGTLRQHYVVNHRRRNMCSFGLLRQEWTQPNKITD